MLPASGIASFYEKVQAIYKDPAAPYDDSLPVSREEAQMYLKAATKATNDKYARIDRAKIIGKLLVATTNPLPVKAVKDVSEISA